jgi:hypothetical protein
MIKKHLSKVLVLLSLYFLSGIIDLQHVHAQVQGNMPQEIKWLWVGSLRSWFSNGGAEIEYGRRGRTFLNTDQTDGLRWPAQFQFQDHSVGKSIWIGTTSFDDPVTGLRYPYKVVCAGRLFMNLGTEIFPENISLIGRFDHPNVIVDGLSASDLNVNDELDGIESSMDADRIIYNKVNTSIGITMTRKVLAFSQQYHDNYYIYEYVFKNTGVIDRSGQQKLNKTLTGVVFHFQFRVCDAYDAYRAGWAPPGANWGLNTINDAVGQDVAHTLSPPNDFRAVFSYYGPFSTRISPPSSDIGGPELKTGSIMCGTHFIGAVTLHVDRSPGGPGIPGDTTNDLSQPSTTQYMGSDKSAQAIDQYDAYLMSRKYGFMTQGHPVRTHAEAIGKDANGWPTNFANTWGGDAGGYAAAEGFGPYTLNIGDSIRIVIAEAVNGISRDKNKEVTRNWFNQNSSAYILPNGSLATDRNIYKNTWVFSGKDSLFQTFRRAISNYNSGYKIPKPPSPPDVFMVESGGDKISLNWSSSADNCDNFNGYQIYRAEGRSDTTFDLIFSCDAGNVAHLYEDKTARRGFNYYYYIVTKDDGSTNDIEPGVPLVSSKFYTMTNQPAYLRRPAGNNLSEIRVVPNPYNIKARNLQFQTGIGSSDRLAFFGLPPFCTIKIYTETGDLIKTINHDNGSGDELWNSTTSSNQLVVSGLYIAYFEVTQDCIDENTGKLLFRKGENIFRKFIIIR